MTASPIVNPPQAANLISPPMRAPFVKTSLVQIGLCVLPSMAIVGFNHPRAAAVCFLATLFTCQTYSVLRRNPMGAATLVIGTLPVWMLLRDYFFYTSLEIVLGLCVLAWMEGYLSDFRAIWADRLIQYLLLLITVYWLLAFWITRDYSANLRGFELLFSALNIRLLARRRRWLATALMGVAVSVIAMGFGLLPYANRLGMAELAGFRIGNPISFGVPAALSLLASLTDGGRWMFVHSRPWLRIMMDAVIGLFLVLSTSRGSWLVLIAGIAIVFTLNRSQRKWILVIVALLISVAAGYVYAEPNSLVMSYIRQTFSPEESWSKRTTGRAEQWAAFPQVLRDAPIWGFGPGNGRRISVIYAHKNLIWHSIYLQVGAETGFIGMALLAILLASLVRRAWRHYHILGEVMPLVAITGFMMIGVSVPALDGLSGMYLGLALAGCDCSSIYVMRRVVPVLS